MKKGARIEDLYQEGLETLYEAENQIVAALPKMISATSFEDLAAALEVHLEETKEQVARLEAIFESMGGQPQGRDSDGMRGILADSEKLIAQFERSPALDLALTGAARKVEHWEMAAYENLVSLAEMLGQQEAVERLQQTLAEEMKADELLVDTGAGIAAGAEEDAKG